MEQQLIDTKNNKHNTVFDDFLENRIKHGWAQILIASSFYIIWLCDGGESLIVAFVLPIIKKEWSLTDSQMSLVGSLIFLGWGIGAIACGQFSDRFGRRKTMIYGCFFQFVFGFLSTFCTGYMQFLVLRGLFGFANGLVNPLTSTYISEIVPKSNRGRFFVHVFNAFPIGEIIIVFFAAIFFSSLDEGNWRALLFIGSIPGLLAYLSSIYYLIESPRYQLCCTSNNSEEVFANLNYMGKLNNEQFEPVTQTEKEYLKEWGKQSYKVQEKKIGDIKELFRGKNYLLTLKLMMMWFSLSFVYYGIVFILPLMILQMRKEEGYENNEAESKSMDFFGIFLACFAEIPSNILAFYTIENPKFGRKNSMIICYGICSICCILCYFNASLSGFFFFLVGCVKFFINFSFCTIFPFTAEVYITALRTTGIGVNNSVCRFGGVIMPWISILLLEVGVTGPFIAFAIISALSAISAYTIEKDTTNINLDTYNNEDNDLDQTMVQEMNKL
ncbi:hypothetical protein ABPG74_001407 [Tetrahymena malaccensis]